MITLTAIILSESWTSNNRNLEDKLQQKFPLGDIGKVSLAIYSAHLRDMSGPDAQERRA
jgi:hypothetical protein